MWSPDSGKDPGGSGPPQQSSQELADLKDQFEQQQVLISQLKEMLRKTEQTKVSQERVEEMANTLTKMNARAKRSKLKREGEGEKSDAAGAGGNRRQIDTPAKEKINLLRQQLEENKAKLAERGKSQKDIEEMVIQLKAQLDDSQNLINQSPLNLSQAEPKIDSYSPETNPQELYRILLLKEKRVSELSSKVQKLEGTVLDLQENIKEKDQVIDARTKAITLMSENLSKKGKHTVDMLEETKQQMRKMQENFVQLESDMEGDKQKLLKELEDKNKEIDELRATNSVLETENAKLQTELEVYKNESVDIESYKKQIQELSEKAEKSPRKRSKKGEKSRQTPPKEETDNKVAELQNVLDKTKEDNEKYVGKIAELEDTIKELNKQIEAASKSESSDEEIAKLKKQIDESNKNMIKVKAQHKSKVKELMKKIEAFKSVSDSNAEIVRLESDNTKLSKKVEELQQEKDSLLSQQSGSKEDSALLERVEELEQKIKELSEELTSKEKEIEDLKQKTDVSADHVASAIDSITFEEQLDKLEADKRIIQQEKEDAVQENKALLENLEQSKKEKQEIVMKLEHYMQENMDLIDKLEKLSAEKVSSAESIEIVESLTQQEKLELEAYQKQMEFMKTSQENLDQNVELNESVNQLTEETSELLQKIELFTVERREVMEKMETLAQENAQLNLKVKEIENNRDVLAETYEQLQNEKDELDKRFQKLEEEHAILLKQNERESERDDLQKRIEELDEELARKNSEIANLESIVNDAKTEVISSANTINDLQRSLNEVQSELEASQKEVVHLNAIINDLHNAANNSEAVEVMENQLEELKQLLNENIQQTEGYKIEIADNSNTIQELKSELNRLTDSLLEMEHALHSKDDEIKKLSKDRANLQEELKTKNENFQRSFEELKARCQKMAVQIHGNQESLENIKKPLEEKIADLTNKNKEQFEKMKKIAANLKKKSAAYQELEEKYGEIKEKWETENKEKEDLRGSLERKDLQIVEFNQKVSSLVQQLHEVEDELSTVQNRLAQKQKEHDDLLEEFNTFKESCMSEKTDDKLKEFVMQQEQLQQALRQYENQIAALATENEILTSQQHNVFNTEIHSKDEEIAQMKAELQKLQESSTNHSNALQAKIQELEMFIENQDGELSIYKQRVNKLEEGLNAVEERRILLEERTLELGAQLQEKSSSIEEISQSEDELEKRLEALRSHDEEIQKRLRGALEENQELTEFNRQLKEQNEELKHKINLAHNKVSELSEYSERLIDSENENSKLKEQIQQVENHLKHLQIDFEGKLNEKMKELNSQESDMQEQFNRLNEERRGFLEQIEKLSDQLKDYEEQELALKGEIEEYKRKVEENLAVIEELQGKLKEQESVLANVKAANDSNEGSGDVSKLKEIIAEKDKEIQEYQKQNLQLQMQSSFGQTAQFEQLIAGGETQLQDALKKIAQLQETEEKYKVEISENQRKIAALEAQLTQPQQQAVAETPQIATFSWPQEAEDPFSFIAPKTEKDTENNAEALHKKIKTLEFMLYSVEKEKDEAVMQCHDLSKELTHLVYEREQAPKDELASQILRTEDLVDTPQSKAQLHDLEFQPTRSIDSVSGNPQPVVEEAITPNTAYLCFKGDEDKLASQVVKEEQLVETPESRKRLHALEFEEVRPVTEAQKSTPVKEDKAQAKSSYLCYSPQGKSESVALDSFGENDDGWAWGPEEAKLEEEHRYQSESSPQNLVVQLQQLSEKVKVLEVEREHHLEEIRQAQIKSGKLIRKLKELKAKNEQLTSQIAVQSSGFPGLDDAIQDEFKLQIENLEKKVKELTADLAKERLEKDNLKKRIDVLTAANDRMVEMKERQEVEIMSWKQRNRELESKLEQFDWGDDGFETSTTSKKQETPPSVSGEGVEQLQQRIQELNETIKELSLDNEELQALLEEQRNLRISAEKPKHEFAEGERESLQSQLNITVEEKKKLQDELNVLIQKNDVLTTELQRLSSCKERMEVLGVEKKELEARFENVKLQYDGLMKESVDFSHELLDKLRLAEEKTTYFTQESIQKINEEKAVLTAKLAEKEAEIVNLSDSFNNQITLLKTQLEEQNRIIEDLTAETKQLNVNVTEKDAQLQELNEKYKSATSEFELKLSTTIEDLTREWVQQVDQRGSDVAESWKLHLETRESEFMQLEQQLRKEMDDLEEKCNSLVNENNELRKNVDAEIRNEVDRVAALQQQISDKQSSISELNRSLQDKEGIIDSLQKELLESQSSLSELQNQLLNNELKITDYETTLVIKEEELTRNQELVNDLNEKLRKTSEEQLSTKTDQLQKVELQKQLEDSEFKFQKLQQELLEKQSVLTQSTVLAEEYKFKLQQLQDNQNLLQQELANKDGVIAELNRRLGDLQADNKSLTELQQQLYDSQQQVSNLNQLLQEKHNSFEQVNQELQNSNLLVQNHEATINQLNAYIEEVKRQNVQELANKSAELEQILSERLQEISVLNRRLTDTTNHYEEALSNKESEIESLKLQLDEQIKRYNELLEENRKFRENLAAELNVKANECEELKQRLNELDEEQQKQTNELHKIIEDQVLRIEELKKGLFEKSNDYDALIAEVDMHQHKEEAAKVDEKPVAPSVFHETEEDDLLEPVSRAELDLALYMLHQRDVRCEELTMELMQLLEERDTLQLRLSNAIREKEQLKSAGGLGGGGGELTPVKPLAATATPKSSPTGAIPKSRSSAIVLGATGTELATEAVENLSQARQSEQLANKLSELKTVGYNKDKTLVDEKELRRFQELSILQQHKDIASKLPPEAAARLVDANYTLSRDVQSPSKVLLNWLWGKSTPKVNDV